MPKINKKLAILAEHRQQLVAQAAAQRTALVTNLEPWRTPLALADNGLAIIRYIKRHPVLIVGGIFLFTILRPGRTGKLLQGGWAILQLARKFGPLLLNNKNKL